MIRTFPLLVLTLIGCHSAPLEPEGSATRRFAAQQQIVLAAPTSCDHLGDLWYDVSGAGKVAVLAHVRDVVDRLPIYRWQDKTAYALQAPDGAATPMPDLQGTPAFGGVYMPAGTATTTTRVHVAVHPVEGATRQAFRVDTCFAYGVAVEIARIQAAEAADAATNPDKVILAVLAALPAPGPRDCTWTQSCPDAGDDAGD